MIEEQKLNNLLSALTEKLTGLALYESMLIKECDALRESHKEISEKINSMYIKYEDLVRYTSGLTNNFETFLNRWVNEAIQNAFDRAGIEPSDKDR